MSINHKIQCHHHKRYRGFAIAPVETRSCFILLMGLEPGLTSSYSIKDDGTSRRDPSAAPLPVPPAPQLEYARRLERVRTCELFPSMHVLCKLMYGVRLVEDQGASVEYASSQLVADVPCQVARTCRPLSREAVVSLHSGCADVCCAEEPLCEKPNTKAR